MIQCGSLPFIVILSELRPREYHEVMDVLGHLRRILKKEFNYEKRIIITVA